MVWIRAQRQRAWALEVRLGSLAEGPAQERHCQCRGLPEMAKPWLHLNASWDVPPQLQDNHFQSAQKMAVEAQIYCPIQNMSFMGPCYGPPNLESIGIQTKGPYVKLHLGKEEEGTAHFSSVFS